MKKKLRLKLSTVISRFQTCREKTSAASALPPVFFLSPSNPKKFDTEFPTPPPPPRPSPTRRLATVVVSTAGCRSCVLPVTSSPARLNLSPEVDLGEDYLSTARETPAYLWRKEEKWHVVTCAEEVERRRRKIDCEDDDDDDEEDEHHLFTSLAARRKREIEIRRRRRGRKSKSKSRNSTSSVASGSWFSSDDDEENDEREDDYDDGDDTDTLISSRSFSTDTSTVRPRGQRSCTSPEQPRPSSAASMLSRLVPCGAGQGKVKESFAVVKRSEDPRGDFRRSMEEMVAEKGIYDAADLEQLLPCFLSLNSRHHHRAIVAAFADIWAALFPAESSPHHVRGAVGFF